MSSTTILKNWLQMAMLIHHSRFTMRIVKMKTVRAKPAISSLLLKSFARDLMSAERTSMKHRIRRVMRRNKETDEQKEWVADKGSEILILLESRLEEPRGAILRLVTTFILMLMTRFRFVEEAEVDPLMPSESVWPDSSKDSRIREMVREEES